MVEVTVRLSIGQRDILEKPLQTSRTFVASTDPGKARISGAKIRFVLAAKNGARVWSRA